MNKLLCFFSFGTVKNSVLNRLPTTTEMLLSIPVFGVEEMESLFLR